MKKIAFISILLIAFSVLSSSIRVGFYFSFYLWDTEQFVKTYCINQKMPDLHCEGKCKLSELTTQETENIAQLQEVIKDFWISEPFFGYEILVQKNEEFHTFHYKYPFWEDCEFVIFQPPSYVLFSEKRSVIIS